MGALPNKFPGFQDVDDAASRARFEASYGMSLNPVPGKHLTLMFEAMEAGEIKVAYVIGENPADSEADVEHARELLAGLDLLVVQDIFLTRTAAMADVVLPASVAWAECDGTVTSSERRVQRVRPAVPPPGEARHDHEILGDLAKRLGVDWGDPTPQDLWDELRSLSPMHAGMTYERLADEGGLQWPCPTEDHPGSTFLHGWLWEDDLGGRGPAPFSMVDHEGPAEGLTDEFPLRMTTGRALDSFNTGVQSGGYSSPIRYGDAIDVSPADAEALGLADGERVLVSSPRGSVEMDVRVQPDIPLGLTFTTFHFPELVDINQLTNDAWDPRSGTAEFKAASVRIDKLAGAGRVDG
jgi:formate dehydrogenase major subunit